MQLAPLSVDKTLLKKISSRIALRWRVLPIEQTSDGRIRILSPDSNNSETLENCRSLFNADVLMIECSVEEFEKHIHESLGLGAAAVDELRDTHTLEEVDAPVAAGGEVAMVRFVNDLIRRAQNERATDIHIEPYEDELAVRFRIDGLLHPINIPASLARFQHVLSSRVKVMSQMNIAEKRLPQDGRFRFRAGSDDLDIRVSIIPTIHGESIDLRLLPRNRVVLGLEDLGMNKDYMGQIERIIGKPNGILLVTGPTGHGKTTTLYACLSRINTPEKKIVTIEDPVEYRLRGINQIQTHSKIGLTFAHGLRSVLRQDPDVIMVGEIRDMETAEIAIRSSLTGHFVFSTLHTNDALGAITRLIDMGMEPYLVASSLSAVLSQRLIRLICKECHSVTPACPPRRAEAGVQAPSNDGGAFLGGLDSRPRSPRRPSGNDCISCRGTGYRGRTGIFELFTLNDELRDLILNRAPASLLREKALATGFRNLYQDGRIKIEAGLTSDIEVRRVAESI